MPLHIAYLTGRYPAVTHTFVLREVAALRRLGVTVDTFSVWQSKAADLPSPAERAEAETTHALLPPDIAAFVAAHLRAAATRPAGYARAFARSLALSSPGIRDRMRSLLWFAEAIALWDALRRRGVQHIHAHLDGTAPAVAMLASEFANDGRDQGDAGRLTWSQTIHGPKEFYDVSREHLTAKVRSASFVACISDYARSQVMIFARRESWPKLEVVHCGVDPNEFSVLSRSAGNSMQVLTVCRLDSMKGTAVLIEAMAALVEGGVDVDLTVVGDGPDAASLKKRANQLGLDARITWAGTIGQDRIREFYAGADVFCLPSFAEGVPIVLMEAMAMAIPVVSTHITGIPELIDDGVSGFLVRPSRVDELVAVLRRLGEDPDLRARMGQAGRAKIEGEFDVHRSAAQLRELFARTTGASVDAA